MDDRSDRSDRVDCARVTDLAPTFVDGEVRPEALASAVRRHLIDCAACRSVVQEATALHQWFVPTDEVQVPAGFAARVSRLAFAEEGDSGGTVLRPVPAAAGPVAERGRSSEFAMMMTAVAAAALILVTLLIASDKHADVNSDEGVRANSQLDEQLRQLDELNELEATGSPDAPGTTAPK